MKISIIIPTYNEESRIGVLIDYLISNKGNAEIEVIVVDGSSEDKTVERAKNKNVRCEVIKQKGRANQLNYGASIASGDVLYFIHADTFPPASYPDCIKNSILDGFPSGCCSYNFDSNKFLLKINSFFTQFNGVFAGGGDQTLFVTRSIFDKLGGFNQNFTIMEDFEFTKRLKTATKFKVLKSKALVSARKYEKNNYFKVNYANFIAMLMFWLKIPPQKIYSTYNSLIKY